jgi:hypothetical protein
MTERIQEETMTHLVERFIDKHGEVEKYRHVHRYKGRLYATNGHIAITIPDDPDIPADDDSSIPEDLEELIAKTLACVEAYQPLIVELPPRIRCKTCAGVGEVAKCTACDGEGVIPCPTCGHEMDCEECDGRGAFGPFSGKEADMRCPECSGRGETFVLIPLGNTQFQRHYLERLKSLHGIEIALNVDSQKAMLFRFRDGHGLLMPALPLL